MHRKPYQQIALGGTFDHFHVGHQHFLDFASNIAQELIIGITTEKLIHTKDNPHEIENFHVRKKAVINYCKKKNINCQIYALDDPYGPTIEEKNQLQALVVTQMTQQGGQKINQLRENLKMKSLPIHVCSMLTDSSGQIISSTRIRNGEISRQGEIYFSLFSQNMLLNQKQRLFFSRVQGEFVETMKKNNRFIALVGDATIRYAQEQKTKYNLAVFDGKEQRQPVQPLISSQNIDIRTTNPAGVITPNLAKSLLTAINQSKKHVFVDGEEDLATVVLVLLLPLGSLIYYGQPSQGCVEIRVTELIKHKFHQALLS